MIMQSDAVGEKDNCCCQVVPTQSPARPLLSMSPTAISKVRCAKVCWQDNQTKMTTNRTTHHSLCAGSSIQRWESGHIIRPFQYVDTISLAVAVDDNRLVV